MKLTEQAEAALTSLIKRFENGEIPRMVQMHYRGRSRTGKPLYRWSLQNQLIAWCHDTMDARTFNQWKEVGRSVNKGAKAFHILAPMVVKKKDDPKGGMACIGFKGIPVFRVEDTEGDELAKEVEVPPLRLPPLLEVAAEWGISVHYTPMMGALGSCSQDGSRIELATKDEAVFFHELAHAADARLQEGKKLNGGQHVDQEAVAELSAAVLCNLFSGLDTACNCWSYITSYAGNDKDKTLAAIRTVIARTQAVLDSILIQKEAIDMKEAA